MIFFTSESGFWMIRLRALPQGPQTLPISGMLGMGSPMAMVVEKPLTTGSSFSCESAPWETGMRPPARLKLICASGRTKSLAKLMAATLFFE